jgi:hypothetical protein
VLSLRVHIGGAHPSFDGSSIRNEGALPMPFRHWYAVMTVEGQGYRIGPYATRQMAQRKANELFKGASPAEVTIVYEIHRRWLRRDRY